jgi:hypothetical protein
MSRPGMSLLVAVLATQFCGCAAMARRLATAIAGHAVDRRFAVFNGRTAAFGACLKSTGGGCADPAGFAAPRTPLDTSLASLRAGAAFGTAAPALSAAERALTHPVQRRLNALYNTLSGLPAAPVAGFSAAPLADGGDEVELRFSLEEMDTYLGLVSEATGTEDWQALADRADVTGASRDRILTGYLAAYLGAYFRGGEFVKVTFGNGIDPVAALKERFPLVGQTELERIFPEYFTKERWAFGNVGAAGFVTRTGAVYQFPAIDARLDPLAGRVANGSQIELPSVAADLARVMLEAVFDAHDRLPAASGATGLTVAVAPLRLHDPKGSSVSEVEFGEVNRIANQAEAAVSSAVAPAIRGAGWASLNNEALAKLIETFVAVTVRKVTEKATWCWYSCDIDGRGALAPGQRTVVRLLVD